MTFLCLLQARCLISLCLKDVKSPCVGLWLKQLSACLVLEKLTYTMRQKSAKLHEVWSPFLTFLENLRKLWKTEGDIFQGKANATPVFIMQCSAVHCLSYVMLPCLFCLFFSFFSFPLFICMSIKRYFDTQYASGIYSKNTETLSDLHNQSPVSINHGNTAFPAQILL